MEIPHLVSERLGEESVEATVNLGDDDLVCLTPTRTLVYRSEGLLSDESVSAFSHDVERLDVSEGRRKTKFVFEYVEGSESFTVPGDRAETVLKLLLGGVLSVADVIDPDETVSGVFTFSELTLVVTSARLVKHVGEPVWDEDFEVYPYADVTGLSFEEGSVATQIVLAVNGRPQRIKAPNDEARKVRRTLTGALFAYHDVETLAELNEKVGDDDSGPQSSDESTVGGLTLDDGISPLVGDEEEGNESGSAGSESRMGGSTDRTTSPDRAGAGGSESPAGAGSTAGDAARGSGGAAPSGAENSSADDAGRASSDRSSGTGTASDSTRATSEGTTRSEGTARSEGGVAVDPEDIEAIEDQLSTLTTAVKQQNKLLRDQQETIEQLIEELRRGR